MTCTANVTAPTQLRAESITDQIGDIVIVCTGGGPFPANGAQVPTVNITVSLQTNVTSRILSNGGSDALLLVDEPGSGLPGAGASLGQNVCGGSSASTAAGGAGVGGACPSFVLGTATTPGGATTTWTTGGTGSGASYAGGTTPNVFQGIVSAANQVTFQGVPVLPPVTAGAQRIFRITNIRANVAGLPGGGLPGTTQLVASVSTSNFAILPVTNPVQIAGFVQTGLKTSILQNDFGTAGTFSINQCSGTGGKATAPVLGSVLRYTENFATAFKTRVAATSTTNGLFTGAFFQNTPGTIYNSESGFILPVGGGTAGLADFGTRLRAVFSNVPAGVRIFVSTTNLLGNSATFPTGIITNQGPFNTPAAGATGPIAVEVQSETAPDFGNVAPTVTPTTGNLAEVNLVNGSGEAVWEVINSNPNLTENFDFGVYYYGAANTANNLPAVGTGTVDMSFAPVSSNTSASSSAPIPRFVDLSTAGNIVVVKLCQTDLLFPFVTNEAGFETGMAIANTSVDPFGTAAQNGSCAISFYGDNTIATNSTTTAPCLTGGACTGTINAGKVYTNTVSGIVGSEFQGYAIAVCTFQWAHGFAFISDTHATNLAMGYLAITLTDNSTMLKRGSSFEAQTH